MPSEAEWEYAARGKNNYIYPWGNSFEPSKAVFRDNAGNKTSSVTQKPNFPTWVGALGMVGNIWEWTTSIYDQSRFSFPFKVDGRDNINDYRERVLRGGSWNRSEFTIRATTRLRYAPDYNNFDIGFRCARGLSSP